MRIILKMDLKRKSMGGCVLDSCQEGYGATDGSCEYANVLLSSTACNEIFWLDQDLLASHAVCYSSSHKLHHDMAFLQNFKHQQTKNHYTYSVITCLNDSNANICTVTQFKSKYSKEIFLETGFGNVISYFMWWHFPVEQNLSLILYR